MLRACDVLSGAVMVKALAPGLKIISPIVVLAESETLVVLETSNVAVSAELLGTVGGVQFVAVFQSLLLGLRCQVALPALTSRMKVKVRVKKMILIATAG